MMKLTTKLRMPGAISSWTIIWRSSEHTLALVARKHLPSGHDDIVKDLQPQVCES
jgi:hypothetical protein